MTRAVERPARARPRGGHRGRLVAALRSPLSRLLAGGAVLALLLRAFGGAASSPVALRTIASTAGVAQDGALEASGPDDELLFRAAAAAVSVDDPVVRGRLLRLAQYLEMGGTAEEPDDELVAAARDVGLAGQDLVLRRYLAELARLALAQPSPADLPDEDELQTWVASHPERFTVPARVRGRQVYLGRDRHGAQIAADAAQLLERLRAEHPSPARAATVGDPFPRGDVIDGSHGALARAFGEDFAHALDALPAGSWQGPVTSPFGLHLVWIEERAGARPASFDEVRGRALHAYLRERGEARARDRLAALRCRARRDDACAG